MALEIDRADIIFTGRTAPPDLLYTRSDGEYGSIICSIVGYYRNENFYPVYCLDGGLPGAETDEYGVNISRHILDASEVANNEKVWRIVTNGYPYNNMGLSDDDAYMVTKIAIYCVTGNADFSRYTYDESRPVTVQTYNALRNLVEVVAEDTSIKRQTGTISIDKTTELTELEDYYFQEFLASSRLEETSFEVKNLSDFPEGTFVANTKNNPQTVFNPGEKFRILIPKSGMVEDINGKFNIVGKVKNYPVFYGEAPDGYQNYTVTFDAFGDELAEGNLQVSCNTGSLKVLKVDSETKNPISGIKFELKKDGQDEGLIQETNENGEVVFENLYQGKYILKEIETAKEYKINENTFNINIEFNKQSDITVQNDIIKGWIRIIKQDLENSNVRLEGVKFELYDENMNLLETLETDARGEAISQKYPSVNRKYYLKEVQTIDGYVLDEKLNEITLANDAILDVFIKNVKEPKEPEIIYIDPEPEVIIIENEPEVIIKEVEPEPIYKEVIIGEPKIIEQPVKLPKTGM